MAIGRKKVQVLGISSGQSAGRVQLAYGGRAAGEPLRRTGAARSCLKGHHLGFQNARVLGNTEMGDTKTKREMLCTYGGRAAGEPLRRTGAARSCLKGHHLGLQSARVLGSTEMWYTNTKREMLCTTAREHARMLSHATPAFRAPSFRMPSLAKRQLADLVLRSLL